MFRLFDILIHFFCPTSGFLIVITTQCVHNGIEYLCIILSGSKFNSREITPKMQDQPEFFLKIFWHFCTHLGIIVFYKIHRTEQRTDDVTRTFAEKKVRVFREQAQKSPQLNFSNFNRFRKFCIIM